MTEQGFKRKLTAVLSADAVGYSRLMAEDEASTVKTIATYRKIMSSLIKQHRGRVVDSPGDNVLADFSSVVDAVQCAVALQNEFQTRNAELAENRRMEFRIGINLGDVIDEDDRIYGDGVNIAARLESMADPGGICVSKTAFDQIETKLPLGYEYLGEHPVKNIPKPVGAYRVLMQPRVTEAVKIEKEKPAIMRRKTIIVGAVVVLMVVIGIWQFYMRRPSVEPASVEKMEYPLPDKPSIAVLPFVNMSDDPTQEYFSDGITEDLITGLSKISDLFVIARNSTFTYKGKPVKIRQVAEELGVRYVLEGSVQKAAEKVRVSAQLIDATTGHHIWADRYEGNVANVFALQDNITRKIIEALAVKLTFDEKEAIPKKGTENLEAYLSFLKGWQHYRQNTPDAFLEAIALFEKAIELDPSYWRAYAALANIYFTVYQKVRWSRTLGIDRMDAIIKAKKNLNKAVNRHIPLAHAVAALIHIDESDFEEAIAEAERAVSLDLNDPDSHFVMGYTLISVGRHREAVDSFKRAIRLNPYNQDTYGIGLGIAYFFMLEFEKAVTLLERAFKNNPENERPIWYLPAAYAHLNRMQEAKAALAKLKEFNPIYARLFFIKDAYYLKNPQDYNLITEGMRKAGMK